MSIVNAVVLGVLIASIGILSLYAIRHYFLVIRRLTAVRDRDPMELTGFVLPRVSVLIPMHNEERVAEGILRALLEADYDHRDLQIIAIDDRSTDATGEILDRFAEEHTNVTVLHRTSGAGGKGHALTFGTGHATGEVLLVFDADYVPARATLKHLVVPFCDPHVGAVMGRVVPQNSNTTVLAALLELERAAGYQVGQQAREHLHLTPQFGGTVGGVRRSALRAVGGWNTKSLTEDTDLTFKLVLNGWKVAYVNRVECYEEAPESWAVRRRQIARWAMGHTDCFHRHWREVIRSRLLGVGEKIDALFVLACYLTAPVLVLGWLSSLWLLVFAPELTALPLVVALAFIGFQLFGSQATFAELGVAAYLDRNQYRVLLLPLGIANFFASTTAICGALLRFYVGEHYGLGRGRPWHKTARYRTNGNGNGRRHGNGYTNGNGNGHEGTDATRNGPDIRIIRRDRHGAYRAVVPSLAVDR